MKEGDKILSEWMMFTFFATESDGLNLDESDEGELCWQPVDADEESYQWLKVIIISLII